MQSDDESIHPAEDALINFQPEKNRIDKVLYDGIVDDLPNIKGTMARRFTTRAGAGPDEFRELLAEGDQDLLDHEGNSSSDENEEEDEHYKVGGKRGFQTNIDDFLMAFDSTLVAGLEHRLTRGKTTYRGPLLEKSHAES